MRVVLSEAAHAHHPVQHSASLVTIHSAELGVPDRQVSIRSLVRLIDADVSRTVHRLRPVPRALDIHRAEHVLLEILQVPGDLEQLLAHDVRGVHELVSVTENEPLLVFLDLVADYRSLRMPENQAGPDAWIGGIKIELLGEVAVIAARCFLELMQVRFEIFLLPERRGVDALEHLPVLVASPICSGSMEKLEILQVGRVRDVRPLAEIDEWPVRVRRDDLVFRELAQALELEGIIGEPRPGLCLRHLFPDERILLRDDLLHLRLELLEIIGSEGLLHLEVVVEAVFDRGTEADPGIGTEPAHGRGENVRARMPQHGQRVRVLLRDYPEISALAERCIEIENLSVQFDRDRVAEQPRPNRCDDVARQSAFGSFTGGAVG